MKPSGLTWFTESKAPQCCVLTINSKENGGVEDEDYHVGSPGCGKRDTGQKDCREILNSPYFYGGHLQGEHQERDGTGKEGKDLYGSGTSGAG